MFSISSSDLTEILAKAVDQEKETTRLTKEKKQAEESFLAVSKKLKVCVFSALSRLLFFTLYFPQLKQEEIKQLEIDVEKSELESSLIESQLRCVGSTKASWLVNTSQMNSEIGESEAEIGRLASEATETKRRHIARLVETQLVALFLLGNTTDVSPWQDA